MSEAIRITAWAILLICLSPALYRILRRQERYLDPIWATMFLLALNRLSYVLHVSEVASHVTATVLALVMAHVTHWYQRHDRRP